MKFTAREDIEAPIADVWAVLTDYDAFERAAMRRGADVARSQTAGRLSWQVAFAFKGKRRQVVIRQETANAPGLLVFSGNGKAVEGEVRVELVELGPRRTRMSVTAEVRPLTLAARLFLQSAKLARGRIAKRYQARVAQMATMIEARTRGQAAGF